MFAAMSATGVIACLIVAAVAVAAPAAAQEEEGPAFPDRKETFGAVLGPSALPMGSTAAYAYAGVPEVGGGFRQGLPGFEWEARARLSYLTLSLTAEGVIKVPLIRTARFDLAPYAGAGLTVSSGLRAFDPYTFPYAGARIVAGLTAGYQASGTVRLLASVEVPYDHPFGTGGGGRLTPLAGGGVEILVGDDLSGLFLGQGGLDWVKEPLGVPVVRGTWAVRLGLGVRLF
jgi:hypothetical protein